MSWFKSKVFWVFNNENIVLCIDVWFGLFGCYFKLELLQFVQKATCEYDCGLKGRYLV